MAAQNELGMTTISDSNGTTDASWQVGTDNPQIYAKMRVFH